MGGPLINLNQARKAKARSEADAKAAANRMKYGRTKAEKRCEGISAERASQSLDGKKRDP